MQKPDFKGLGPNVKKLVIHRMSVIAVPSGSENPTASAIDALFRVSEIAKEAVAWVRESLDAVKRASGNPYGADDEAIAGALLELVEKRIAEQTAKLKEEARAKAEVCVWCKGSGWNGLNACVCRGGPTRNMGRG